MAMIWRCAILILLTEAVLCASTIAGSVKCHGKPCQSAVVVYAVPLVGAKVAPPQTAVTMDQVNLTFIPHVLPIVVGTRVNFPNSDEVRHNVFSISRAKSFNLGIYPTGTSRQMLFDKPGEVALLCNIHPEMSAYILVLATPHFSVAGNDGRYNLANLAPGKYTLTVWQERYQSLTRAVEINDRDTLLADFELLQKR